MMWQRSAIVLLVIAGVLCPPAVNAKQGKANGTSDAGRLVLRYAEALSNSRVKEWAAVDLGCLTKRRTGKAADNGSVPPPDAARQCWDETLKAHREMVAYKAEAGVFDAVDRGAGFGLLHDRHRTSENWKEYPPALFVSPAVVRRDDAPAPSITLLRVGPVQSVALVNLAGPDPVSLPGQAVDLKITYRDPITAPLALRPEEVWWVTGAQRKFGPVRDVQARFIVVSGLKKFGYAVDQAVMNEVLPGAPLVATTHYGLRPEAGRRSEGQRSEQLVKGELLPGSPRWWERKDAEAQFRDAVMKATRMPSTERESLLTRLLLLDPTDPGVNAMRGDDAYRAFLKQGVAKGGLAAQDEEALMRLAELYWTLQAQTWRQELTAVAQGHEPAADHLYRAISAYETLAQQQRASAEQRRRLGALHRWNNDPSTALTIHEPLLAELAPDVPLHGLVLADLAWDRIQWVSWERRYDHPWLKQAANEAAQAASVAKRQEHRLIADYALVVFEALSVPRNAEAFETAMNRAKEDLAKIPGTKGVLGHLVANDLVKGLTAEGETVVLPGPSRSNEVVDVAVHADAPHQDILWQWNFDRDVPKRLPAGFVALTHGSTEPPDWHVMSDRDAPSAGQSVVQARPCPIQDCAHLLVANELRTTYPDVTVQVQDISEDGQGEAGVALAVIDDRNYYAVTLQPSTGLVTTRRVSDGVTTVLGQVSVKLAARSWHSVRVQRVNFLHVDKGRLGVFIDGAQVAAVDDTVLPREGRVGLITMGRTTAKFDGLHVVELVSNRPLSGPAAY